MTDEHTEAPKVVKESPQLPETPKEAKVEISAEDQAKELLNELVKLNLKGPELANVVQAARNSGRAQNLLGETQGRLSREIAELRAAIQGLSQKGQSKSRDTDDPNGQTIDLASLIEQKVETGVKKVVNEMSQAQRKQASEFAALRRDRTFARLEPIWNEYLNTPEAQEQLFSGVSPRELYADVKIAFLEKALGQSQESIERLVGQSPEKAKPLHVESSQTRVPSLPQEEDDKKAELRKIDEARASGRMSSDQALRAIFDKVSPPTDPIWNVETAPGTRRKGK